MIKAPHPITHTTYLYAKLDRIERKKHVVLLHVTDTAFEHRILRIFNHQLDFFRSRIGMGVCLQPTLHWYIETDNQHQVRSFSFHRNSGWHVL